MASEELPEPAPVKSILFIFFLGVTFILISNLQGIFRRHRIKRKKI